MLEVYCAGCLKVLQNMQRHALARTFALMEMFLWTKQNTGAHNHGWMNKTTPKTRWCFPFSFQEHHIEGRLEQSVGAHQIIIPQPTSAHLPVTHSEFSLENCIQWDSMAHFSLAFPRHSGNTGWRACLKPYLGFNLCASKVTRSQMDGSICKVLCLHAYLTTYHFNL